MSHQTTRESIVEAADRLFYRHGYDHTSFADIADVVHISRGNFYHHFKSKDEILRAVIALRRRRTLRMLEEWENASAGPAECLGQFIQMLVRNGPAISRHGCPVGTLCGELAKLVHPERDSAAGLFTLLRGWLAGHFAALGFPADSADEHAMHLLARSQGIAALASAFQDEVFIHGEVRLLERWLHSRIAAGPAGQDCSVHFHDKEE